ncbi:hypothetical protein ACET3Z_030204 [Daucus carota]
MSSSKLFIGGLSFQINEQCLRDAFSSFGDVDEAKIITDRDSGRSKGFGFVTFADSESASSAVSAMDGQPLNGRNIRVSFANDKPRNTFGDNSGGGGGGYETSHQIAQNFKTDLRFQSHAFLALQEAAEAFIEKMHSNARVIKAMRSFSHEFWNYLNFQASQIQTPPDF